MQLRLPESAVTNPLAVMRKAGYSPFVDPVTRKESYVLRFSSAFYPRFHVYVKNDGQNVIFDIHLDQKQPSYGEGNMHGGEYDGPVIEREVKRIASWANATKQQEHAVLHNDDAAEMNEKPQAKTKKWFGWFN